MNSPCAPAAGCSDTRGEAADLGEPLLQLEHHREIALHGFRLLQRMGLGKARDPRDLLVDPSD